MFCCSFVQLQTFTLTTSIDLIKVFQVGLVSYYPNNPYLLAPLNTRSLSVTSQMSCTPSIRSTYSARTYYSSRSSPMLEYQCSDPAEIFQFRKKLRSILPILRGSVFLSILFAVFVFYAATVLLSVFLIVLSIWL